MPEDLSVQAFLRLRQLFFAPDGRPYSLDLRDKGATQDDPLDEYIATSLKDMDSDVQLSFEALFHQATLIHTRPNLDKDYHWLKRIMIIERKGTAKTISTFYAYRLASDVLSKTVELTVQDPFTRVRKEGQGQRGRLALDISILSTSLNETSEDIDIEPGNAL